MDIIIAVVVTAIVSVALCKWRERVHYRRMQQLPVLGVVLPPERKK